MLNFRHGARIFISTEPTDMRKGFDGLTAIVEHQWKASPLSGDMFVFSNRRRTLLKLLYWDADGYAIWYKDVNNGILLLPQKGAGTHFLLISGRLGWDRRFWVRVVEWAAPWVTWCF